MLYRHEGCENLTVCSVNSSSVGSSDLRERGAGLTV